MHLGFSSNLFFTPITLRYIPHEQYQVCTFMDPYSFPARSQHVLPGLKSDISETRKCTLQIRKQVIEHNINYRIEHKKL